MGLIKWLKNALCRGGFHDWEEVGDCRGYGIDLRCRRCGATRSETSIGN